MPTPLPYASPPARKPIFFTPLIALTLFTLAIALIFLYLLWARTLTVANHSGPHVGPDIPTSYYGYFTYLTIDEVPTAPAYHFPALLLTLLLTAALLAAFTLILLHLWRTPAPAFNLR